MALTPKLEFRQKQLPLMTGSLRQAIGLLAMSNLELSENIENELEQNPFLEREGDFDLLEEKTEQTIDDYDKASEPEEDLTSDVDYDNEFDDSSADFSWDDYGKKHTVSADEDFDYFEQRLKADKSLYDILDEQIELKFSNAKQKMVAKSLVAFLDESGYFRANTDEIAQKLGLKPAALAEILQAMQQFEPSGIFARNLSECLRLQLQEQNQLTPAMDVLLQNLDVLAERNLKTLKKLCDVSDAELLDMIKQIRALNPKPAADYAFNGATYIVPDVIVKTNKYGEYLIELNPMSLPKILINQHYCSMVRKNGDKIGKKFLREKMSHANFLIKALNQRANTILKVSEEIVRAQREFLQKGVEFLKPMQLKDVAEQIEMHESTVSRISNNKYMLTPRGIFELKYFFSNAAVMMNGTEDMSTMAIKYKIKELIDKETADNILSDDAIVEMLAVQGIKIARRTVAKYREAINLPTSAERKRQKRNAI